MSGKFLTELEVKEIKPKLWELRAPLVYQSGIIGTVTVPEGFRTDFCSVPRLPLVFMIDGDCGNRAGVVHDHLYSDPSVSRSTADAVLREALEACGVGWFRRWSMFWGVRSFGWLYKKNVTRGAAQPA